MGFPSWCLPKECSTEDATSALWERLAHLLNHSLLGQHPERDERDKEWPEGSLARDNAGKPICNGESFLVFWSGAGDLECMANDLKFPHHQSNRPCWLCQADRIEGSANAINDCRTCAPWKTTLIPCSRGYRQARDIASDIGHYWCQSFSFHGYILHTCHLGVDAWLVGAVIADIVENSGWRGNRDDRVARLWDMIQEEYRSM